MIANAKTQRPVTNQKAADSTTAISSKTCSKCLRVLPVERFRRFRKGSESRQPECNACRVLRERAKRQALRDREKRREIERFNKAVVQARGEELLPQFVYEITKRLGGLDQLCSQWFETLQLATPNRRLRGFEAIGKILEFISNQDEKELAGLQELGRQEIADSLEAELLELIKKDPAIAVRAALEIGWKVDPVSG